MLVFREENNNSVHAFDHLCSLVKIIIDYRNILCIDDTIF